MPRPGPRWTSRRDRRAAGPTRPRPAPGVRPHHGGRAAADHARGRLRRARPHRRRASRARARAHRGARVHARPGPRGGAARGGRAPAAGRGRRAVRQGERRHLARQPRPLRAAADRPGRSRRGGHGERDRGRAGARRERGLRVRRPRPLRHRPGLRPQLHDPRPLGRGAGSPARGPHRRPGHDLRRVHARLQRRRQPARDPDVRAHARGGAADLHRPPGGQPRHQPRAR